MGFWDNVLGTDPAPVQQQAPAATPAWFIPQTSAPHAQPVQYQYQQPQQPVEELPLHARNAQARNDAAGRCPSCGSGNYSQPSPSAAPRCFDCGFSPRGIHATIQGASTGGNVPVQSAKQVAGGEGFRGQAVNGQPLAQHQYND